MWECLLTLKDGHITATDIERFHFLLISGSSMEGTSSVYLMRQNRPVLAAFFSVSEANGRQTDGWSGALRAVKIAWATEHVISTS